MVALYLPPESPVLVADGDPACREQVGEMLRAEGFRPRLARTGREAVRIAGEMELRLSVLGEELTDLSGLETLELIRRIRVALPTVLLGGARNKERLLQLFAAGHTVLVPKPLDARLLRATVARIMSRYYPAKGKEHRR